MYRSAGGEHVMSRLAGPAARRISARLWPVLCLVAMSVPAARLAAGATPQQVDAAVDRAVKYLYSVQADGTWEAETSGGQGANVSPSGMHHGGLTAIAAYALLAAGEKPADARLAKALDFLKNLDTKSAYVSGVR